MAGVALGQGGAPAELPSQQKATALREIIVLMEDEAADLRSQIEAMRAELAAGQVQGTPASEGEPSAGPTTDLAEQLETAQAEARAAEEKAAAAARMLDERNQELQAARQAVASPMSPPPATATSVTIACPSASWAGRSAP